MFYPKHFGPETEYQQLSILHSQLAAAYSIIAQYEEQERKHEDGRVSKSLRDMMNERRARPEREAPKQDAYHQPTAEGPGLCEDPNCECHLSPHYSHNAEDGGRC